MTIVTNTYQTFTQIGNREALSNAIYNISPEDTPFCSAIGKRKGSAKFEEWQTDALAAIDLNNKQVEGDEADFPVVAPTTRLGNRMQILRKTLIISGTAETVEHAGRRSEVAYQVAKRGQEIKRDLEGIVLNNQASSAGNSSTAATLGSVLSWITTNSDFGAGAGADPVTPGSTTRTNGDLRDLTEAQLATVLASIYNVSGEQPDMILTPPSLKGDISAFPGNATRFIQATAQKIVAGVNLYSGEFGEYKIVPDRHMTRAREVLVINSDYWKLAWLRPLKVEDLAKTGDAMKKMLIMEVTLEASNEAASGIIADVQVAS